MAITIEFIITSLPDRLAPVRDALLRKHPSALTIDVLQTALLDIESNIRSIASVSGTVVLPIFQGCTVPQLPTFTASLALVSIALADPTLVVWGSEVLGFESQCVHFGHPSAGGCQRSIGDPRLILGKGYWLASPGGESFFLVFIDDYSRYTTVFPLAKKSDMTSTLIRWLLATETTRSHRVSCLHSERGEASPTSLWTGSPGVASEFRIWGCLALVRDTSAGKLSARTLPCVFLGFPLGSSVYTFYHTPLHRFLDSRDITFDESVSCYTRYPCRGLLVPPPSPRLPSSSPPLLLLLLSLQYHPLPHKRPRNHRSSHWHYCDRLPLTLGVLVLEAQALEVLFVRVLELRVVTSGVQLLRVLVLRVLAQEVQVLGSTGAEGTGTGGASSRGAGVGGSGTGCACSGGAGVCGTSTSGASSEGMGAGGTEAPAPPPHRYLTRF
ncbi:unnamed protein product [Closterium sp. NIES-54]